MGKQARPPRARRITTAAVITLVVCAALAALAGPRVRSMLGSRLERQSATTHGAGDSHDPRHLTAGQASRYRVGDVLVYALAHEAAIDATEGGRFYQLAASGDWTLQVLSLEHGETLLAASLQQARLKSSSGRPGQDEEYRRVERALSEPTFVSLNARGAVVAIRVDPSMPRAATDLLRSIIALSQDVASDGAGDQWTTTETDATGKYLAHYQRLAAHGGVSKRKLSYTEVQAGIDPGASQLQVEVLASEGTFMLDDRGLVAESRVRDVVRSRMQLVPEMTATTMLALTRKSLSQDLTAVSALRDRAAKLQAVALYDTPPSNDEQLAIDRAKVAGRSLGDFLHALAEVPKSEKESEDQRNRRRRLFIEFAALLRLDDKAVDQLMARILSGEEDDPSLLWDALASAGSPKAQAALRQLIDDPRFDVREHRMQMIGLSFAPQPTAETVHYLASKFGDEDQAQQARFGVGTALNHLRGKDDGLLNEGLQTLTAQLSASKTMGETSDYLLALGNSGVAAAQPSIMQYLDAPTATVRAAAAMALRYMPGADVEPTLIDLIKNDRDGLVRGAAVEAARERTPTHALLDAVYDAAQGETDPLARKQAVATLEAWSSQAPAIGEAIAAFKQSAQGSTAP